MKRSPPQNSRQAASTRVQPSAELAEMALRQSMVLMAPIAVWLLRHGVSYPAFAEQLKGVFLAAARRELESDAAVPTQSALSLLSGVHRKDVRTLESVAPGAHVHPRPPLSAQVFTRWLTDRRWRHPDGTPRVLTRNGADRSFEALCRELSNDVHPRTVLDELLRHGHVAVDGDTVTVQSSSFVPAPHLDELTALFASGVSDHISAGVENITRDGPKFLEQSIYADGLTQASIDELHAAARAAWAQAFESMVVRARERVDRDADGDGRLRMRYGVYFYSEAVPADAHPARGAPPSTSPTPAKRVAARGKKS